LKICSEFSIEYQAIFNPTKSQLVYFGEGVDDYPPFAWSGQIINVLQWATHLGHIVGENDDERNLEKAINVLYSRVNVLVAQFGHCFSTTKYKLFKSFGMSLYGCVIWNFTPRKLERFCVAWRKSVRKIFNVPYLTHSNLLPLICADLSPELQLHVNIIKMAT
jgi:hypothetical protein